MALITGLYKPTSGHILLGDCDLTALDLSAVRGYVGVVEQTVGLLSGTITSNIAYGKVSKSMRCKHSCVDDLNTVSCLLCIQLSSFYTPKQIYTIVSYILTPLYTFICNI